MAGIVENHEMECSTGEGEVKIPSNSKVNAALTLGIIGTALSGINALGGLGNMFGVFGGGNSNGMSSKNNQAPLTNEDVWIERRMACEKYENMREMYDWKLENLKNLTDAFFQSYKRDVDNSFGLYKYNRDHNDIIYGKLAELDKKVDMMGAIRPYQDALIDSKINTNALIADFNLARRTCKMIEGQLVLPSTPVVEGYGSIQSTPYTPIR